MTVKAQIILLVILLVALIFIIGVVRKGKLHLKYALPWLACVIVLAALVAIPNAIQGLASLLGIYSPVNMVFFLGFVFLLAIVFVLTMSLSKMTARIRQLSQAVALLEKRLQEERETSGRKSEKTEP